MLGLPSSNMVVKRGETFAVGELPLSMGGMGGSPGIGELFPRTGKLAGALCVGECVGARDPTVDTLGCHSEYHLFIHNKIEQT